MALCPVFFGHDPEGAAGAPAEPGVENSWLGHDAGLRLARLLG